MGPWSIGGLSTVSSDTGWSVNVTFDNTRYLFNTPENMTRATTQHRRGFKKTSAVFLTRLHTEVALGLPGFLMSTADSGRGNISIFGPQGLGLYLSSTRQYAVRSHFGLTVTEIASTSSAPCFKDENVSIYAVSLAPGSSIPGERIGSPGLKRKRSEDATNLDVGARKQPRQSEGPDHPTERAADESTAGPSWQRRQPGKLWQNLEINFGFAKDKVSSATDRAPFERVVPPCLDPLPLSLVYICVGAQVRGKFDAARAGELGVQGKDRRRLTQGESVTLANGTVITPEMLIAPPLPSTTCFVVDIPSLDYIDALCGATEFARHRPGAELPVHCIYYHVGEGVLQDERFKSWMHSFGPDVHHLISGGGHAPDTVALTTSAYMLRNLSHLDSDMFRVPYYNSTAAKPLSSISGLPEHTHLHDTYKQVIMRPTSAPSTLPRIVEDRFHTEGIEPREKFIHDHFPAAFAPVQKTASELPEVPSSPGDDVQVTTLGTGSAVPSVYRNVSATLIEIPGHGNLLLDCGEGTWGQMQRRWGPAKTIDILRNLRCVFISHNHADHHIGLARVLSKRQELLPDAEPLYLIAPSHTLQQLFTCQKIEDLGLSSKVRVIYNEDLRVDPSVHTVGNPTSRAARPGEQHFRRTQTSKTHLSELCAALKFDVVETVYAAHRCIAFSAIFRHADGWGLAYSGDTMPHQAFVDAGQHVTLLIHEATMANDQEEMASVKGHSTFGQALDVATRMNARNVLLTHFSGRYPKMMRVSTNSSEPLIDDIDTPPPAGAAPTPPATAAAPIVGIAFDLLTVRIGAMRKLNCYLPALEACFAAELESEDVAAPGAADDAHVHVD